MKNQVLILGWLALFLLGSFDVVWAGGGGGGSKSSNTKLSQAQIEEIAKDPSKLKTLTNRKSSRVKVDAVARVLNQIATNDGVDDPKIVEILTIAFNEMNVSPSQLGTNMVNSPYKNQILVLISNNFGSDRAQSYQETSGATFPAPPAVPPTENNQPPQQQPQQDQGQNPPQQPQQDQGQNPPPPPPPPPPPAPPYPGQSLP
jgi:hypothetical protein